MQTSSSSSSSSGSTRKRKREETEELDYEFIDAVGVQPNEDELNEAEILRLVEEVEDVEELDERGVKTLMLNFERKLNTNVGQRLKYADEPEKFVGSEVDLLMSVKGKQKRKRISC
eukprot:TRINITY_DN2408_c0_g1_i2.p1 TRINITY_DN2408_c0_g1~~TRINITY_DN2408_c0_g1_i2.p1  ORF type:complete len:116 (+),score=48.07 TRINITY_DN2408_c0_g1_i2:102-449(+)